jgi:hypothetical protein
MEICPLISVITTTKNEEVNIENCLKDWDFDRRIKKIGHLGIIGY